LAGPDDSAQRRVRSVLDVDLASQRHEDAVCPLGPGILGDAERDLPLAFPAQLLLDRQGLLGHPGSRRRCEEALLTGGGIELAELPSEATLRAPEEGEQPVVRAEREVARRDHPREGLLRYLLDGEVRWRRAIGGHVISRTCKSRRVGGCAGR